MLGSDSKTPILQANVPILQVLAAVLRFPAISVVETVHGHACLGNHLHVAVAASLEADKQGVGGRQFGGGKAGGVGTKAAMGGGKSCNGASFVRGGSSVEASFVWSSVLGGLDERSSSESIEVNLLSNSATNANKNAKRLAQLRV